MARALGLAVALALLAVPAASALPGPTGKLIAGSEETALRLHDLPPGYRFGAEGGCAPLGPVGEEGKPAGRLERRYLKWIVRYWPEGCSYLYKQVFEVPDLGPAPPEVQVEIVNTPSEEAAASGFELIDALIKQNVKKNDGGTVTLSPSGVQARLVRSRSFLVDGKRNQPGSVLFWHHGKLIGYMQVAGLNPRRNDHAAIHYAQIQQWRMEHPSPYTEAEQNDSEVWLDDPGLKFPIYWVGNPFQPADSSPVGLEFAYTGNSGPPGMKYELDYFSFEDDGFHIGGWTRRSWKRFQRSALGKANRSAHCTRTTEIELERGRAVIYGPYDRERLRSCPRRSPDRYYAIAHIGLMVIGVNVKLCFICEPGVDSGPYSSLGRMKAIVRALALRPKPVY